MPGETRRSSALHNLHILIRRLGSLVDMKIFDLLKQLTESLETAVEFGMSPAHVQTPYLTKITTLLTDTRSCFINTDRNQRALSTTYKSSHSIKRSANRCVKGVCIHTRSFNVITCVLKGVKMRRKATQVAALTSAFFEWSLDSADCSRQGGTYRG